jgi:tetratricopeptide (TPR) repeat protein
MSSPPELHPHSSPESPGQYSDALQSSRPSPSESIHSLWAWVVRHVLLATPAHQNTLILGSSALLLVLVLSGALLYRQYDPADLVRRGEWYMKQGKAVLATHQFERLVRNHPNYYEGYFLLGRAYLEINDPEKAANAFARAAQLGGEKASETRTVVALAEYIIAKGSYEKAELVLLKAWREVSQAKRVDPFLNSAIVNLYLTWGDAISAQEDAAGNGVDYEKAFELYWKCMAYVVTPEERTKAKKRLTESLDNVLSVYIVNQENKKAEEALIKALKYDKNPAWMKALADLFRKQAKLEKALVWYERAYSENPALAAQSLVAALQEKELEQRASGNTKDAEKTFERASKIANKHGFRIRPMVERPLEKTGDKSNESTDGRSTTGNALSAPSRARDGVKGPSSGLDGADALLKKASDLYGPQRN